MLWKKYFHYIVNQILDMGKSIFDIINVCIVCDI